MKILAVQLKRIGDLILTTPALAALKAKHPGAEIVLAVEATTAPLLPAIPHIAGSIVFGRGRGWAPWQQVLTGRWDLTLDFTGSDRSAAIVALSRAKARRGFADSQRKGLRRLAYTGAVPSAVRDFHTMEHYLHLVEGSTKGTARRPELQPPESAEREAAALLNEAGIAGEFAILHAGAARPEKMWTENQWAEVAGRLQRAGLSCVLTGGNDAAECAHVEGIISAVRAATGGSPGCVSLSGRATLPALAALVRRARLVVSGDTAIVHLAAAFEAPQVVLYGPTNPFHWHPRHSSALAVSAAQPERALTEFSPRMRGAPMNGISTGAVVDAIDTVLQMPRSLE